MMPPEAGMLSDRPPPVDKCPACDRRPFDPFLRGHVQSGWRRFWGRPYCAVICCHCKEIVGWEHPTMEPIAKHWQPKPRPFIDYPHDRQGKP